jgi:hypothetical protein
MFRPNPPRMITVLVAIALLAVGLAGTVVSPELVRDLVSSVGLPGDLQRQILSLVLDRTVAYLCLLASPMVLVAGSLLPGI